MVSHTAPYSAESCIHSTALRLSFGLAGFAATAFGGGISPAAGAVNEVGLHAASASAQASSVGMRGEGMADSVWIARV